MEKVLKNTKCYQVGPMEFVSNGRSWRDKCKQEFEKLEITCYDPYEKPFLDEIEEDEETHSLLKKHRANLNLGIVHEHMRQIVAVDLATVDRADFIVCYINPEIPTFGSIHELVVANQAKKPVFIFIEGGIKKTPLWLLGLFKPKYFYNSLDEIVDTIKQINNGNIKIDNKRWRLLKPEFR